jgi:hypothetical protein
MEFTEVIDEHHHGLTRFPTICKCCVCHGVNGFFKRGIGQVNDRAFAASIAQIQHGYYLAKWEHQNVAGKEDWPFRCECKCGHEFSEVSEGHCLHKLTCNKCGTVVRTDSSD